MNEMVACGCFAAGIWTGDASRDVRECPHCGGAAEYDSGHFQPCHDGDRWGQP